eukprot:5988678-Pyramimonas_sp.AAC.1
MLRTRQKHSVAAAAKVDGNRPGDQEVPVGATVKRSSALAVLISATKWILRLLVWCFRSAVYITLTLAYTAALKLLAFSLGALVTTVVFSNYRSSTDEAHLQKIGELARSTDHPALVPLFFSGLRALSFHPYCSAGHEDSDVCNLATGNEDYLLGLRDIDVESLEVALASTRWTLILWAQALLPLANALLFHVSINAKYAAVIA